MAIFINFFQLLESDKQTDQLDLFNKSQPNCFNLDNHFSRLERYCFIIIFPIINVRNANKKTDVQSHHEQLGKSTRAGRGACADCAPHKTSRCLRPFRCTTQGLAAPTFQAIFAQGLAIFSAGPDQDHDDIHIIGLILNAFHVYWPSLIKLHFLELFITPIVTVRRDNSILEFYSLPEYHVWKYATKNIQSYKIKYNKGLGGVAENDIKKYFSNINDHRIKLCYMDNNDDDAIEMAFSVKEVTYKDFIYKAKIGLSEFIL
ncbi:DNA topoisomerase 2-beta [Dermatophagoides farinae]|uniref:DNA topoisomerase (ATP-hydrolyzing) n=1 Tax=Dermatophagoides farinae TaxID=6954 RepID=A0A922L3L6_DERFA|nr:DNA topoisomerase 2-beta [Dermatophagoides farinae]